MFPNKESVSGILKDRHDIKGVAQVLSRKGVQTRDEQVQKRRIQPNHTAYRGLLYNIPSAPSPLLLSSCCCRLVGDHPSSDYGYSVGDLSGLKMLRSKMALQWTSARQVGHGGLKQGKLHNISEKVPGLSTFPA